MKKTISVMLDGEPVEFDIVPKREVTLHKVINWLPFMTSSYMNFWTTIGRTVAVPDRAADDQDFGERSWVNRYILTLRHEGRHSRRAQRWTLPVYATVYLGPSVTLGLPALLVCLIVGLATGSWLPLAVAGGLTALLAPLTAGLAIGRALDEWDAYLESVAAYGKSRAEQVAQTLWKNYFFTIPPKMTMRHFARKLDKPEWLR